VTGDEVTGDEVTGDGDEVTSQQAAARTPDLALSLADLPSSRPPC
jgi:hypothetical protein